VSGVTYGEDWSATLQNEWQPVPDTGTAPQHTFSVPIGSNTKLFLRLTIAVKPCHKPLTCGFHRIVGLRFP